MLLIDLEKAYNRIYRELILIETRRMSLSDIDIIKDMYSELQQIFIQQVEYRETFQVN